MSPPAHDGYIIDFGAGHGYRHAFQKKAPLTVFAKKSCASDDCSKTYFAVNPVDSPPAGA